MSRALQLAAKLFILKSIVKSKRIIPNNLVEDITGTVVLSDMLSLAKRSLEELRKLRIIKVKWIGIATYSLGFTLSDGQTCKAGRNGFSERHTFDPAKKITKVECIISNSENSILQTNFYHKEERLVAVGWDDENVKKFGLRKEVFEITDNEELIGCELDH